ncbi:unnamed protein product, partial [Vitis vinifera]
MAARFRFPPRAWYRRRRVGSLSPTLWSLTTLSFTSTPCSRWSQGIKLKRSSGVIAGSCNIEAHLPKEGIHWWTLQ